MLDLISYHTNISVIRIVVNLVIVYYNLFYPLYFFV